MSVESIQKLLDIQRQIMRFESTLAILRACREEILRSLEDKEPAGVEVQVKPEGKPS